jgi:hypothetical protein
MGSAPARRAGVRSTQLVPTLTLDWLADRFPPPDVIKIDVEQAEAAVLTGGPGVLDRARAVICEVAGRNSETVRGLLVKHGYTLYDGDRPSGDRVPLTGAPANTMAIRVPAL